MVMPEDELMNLEPLAPEPTPEIEPEVSYTPPLAWGTDRTLAPASPVPTSPSQPFSSTTLSPTFSETLPPIVSPASPAPVVQVASTPQTSSSSPTARTFLIGLILILVGILLGVLASFLLPAFTYQTPMVEDNTDTPEITPEPTISDESEMPLVTPAVTITPAPTATPSALLGLKWNLMTVNSPISFFSSYRIHYPTTWTIKEYKNTPKANDEGSSSLTLQKGKATVTILQANTEASSCDYDGSVVEGFVFGFADYRAINKENQSWRWGAIKSGTVPMYPVCEMKDENYSSQTSIGFISLTGSDLDTATIEEFNYILEKIVILKK